MIIKQKLVSKDKHHIKCPNAMTPMYITVHNTWNDASAANEISYMSNNNNEVSFHIAVDDVEAIQGIPFNRNAWHCGDGNGDGNRKSIGVEICYSKSGGKRYFQAEKNAAKVIAGLMKDFKIPLANVVQHNKWSGKDCPHRIRKDGYWNDFIKNVEKEYKALTAQSKRYEFWVDGKKIGYYNTVETLVKGVEKYSGSKEITIRRY